MEIKEGSFRPNMHWKLRVSSCGSQANPAALCRCQAWNTVILSFLLSSSTAGSQQCVLTYVGDESVEAQGWFSWEKNILCSPALIFPPLWLHTSLPFPGKTPALLELMCAPHISGICYHFGTRLYINLFASHFCQVEMPRANISQESKKEKHNASSSNPCSSPSPSGLNHTQ